MNLKKRQNGCNMHTLGNVRSDSAFAKIISLLFYAGLIVMPLVIIMWFWGYLDGGKLTLYIFYIFIPIVAFLFIKRDALFIFIFSAICIMIFFIECLVSPYIFFPKLIPEIFKKYWLFFSLGYFGIILRYMLAINPREIKKLFYNRQKYLQQGIIYISFGGKLKKLSFYKGTLLQICIKIGYDLFTIGSVFFVMIQGIILIYGQVPLMTFKTYLGVCSSVVLTMILARIFPVIFYGIIFLLTAKKAKHTRFVFASDDA